MYIDRVLGRQSSILRYPVRWILPIKVLLVEWWNSIPCFCLTKSGDLFYLPLLRVALTYRRFYEQYLRLCATRVFFNSDYVCTKNIL